MNLKNASIESFINIYKTALKDGITFEELSLIANLKEKSIKKRRSEIKRLTGFDLPFLKSSPEINYERIEKFQQKFVESKNDELSEKEESGYTRFVITAAQNATPINEAFLASILTYCDVNDAKLMVVPYRYKNPTSIWNSNNTSNDWWDSKIASYIVEEDISFNNSITLLASIKIQPTNGEPINGFESYTGNKSSIFGHPRIQYKTVATPNNYLPKILTSTGAITLENYTDTKTGFKGKFHHTIGAIVLEINNDIFHLRHIIAGPDGSFYDLNYYYNGSDVVKIDSIPAIVTGDTHAEFIDESVEQATYTDEYSLVNILNPQYLVFHDITDFYSRNHHHRNNDVMAVSKQMYGGEREYVEDGLQFVADFLDRVSRVDTTNVIVRSNHDEALDRWLKEDDGKNDPANAQFYHYLKYHQIKNIELTDTGYKTINPFEFWCRNPDQLRGLQSIDQTIFLGRDESMQIEGIEIGFHGDISVNGAKGNIKSMDTIGSKTIIGHSHAPGIYGGAYQVGTSSKLNLEYKVGPSNWMHTHCLIYPNGKRTLINIVKGQWTTMFTS